MGTANLTTMPRLVCIQVAILMLAMSFALAESNSAPDWVGGCTKPPECRKECKSGDADYKVCKNACAHKWEYSSQKGPYKCGTPRCGAGRGEGKKEREFCKNNPKECEFWCPEDKGTVKRPSKQVTDAKQAVRLIGAANFKVNRQGMCMPTTSKSKMKALGLNPVRVKFMENEPHKHYAVDSKKFMANEKAKNMKTTYSRRGAGVIIHPWVTPGVSNCSPKSKKPAGGFIKYFEDLKKYTHVKDKIGKHCAKISRRKVNSEGKECKPNRSGGGCSTDFVSTAETLRKAGRCK